MGTRNLTVVRYRKEYVVAQYGQWDGYPDGQGQEILKFLKNWDRPKFESALQKVSFITDADVDALNEKLNNTPNWQEKYPAFTRDTAAKILQYIQDSPPGEQLQNQLDFAGDSLFCEWAYVIDLDENKFEVYKGFNKEPLGPTERFFDLQKEGEEYYPVKLAASYDLDNLPTVEKMVEDCDKPEEEEE
jgi:hypothetical protein